MSDIAFSLPINRVSFGQVSSLILRTLYERELAGQQHNIHLFPIGNVDLSAQATDENFQKWVKEKVINGLENYNRDIPIFKLWHLNGSLESASRQQTLLTFYELDEPTKVELNVARNNWTYFSSKYSCDVFAKAGVKTGYLPLAFDSYNFKPAIRPAHLDDRITFNLCGKWEKRKNHEKIVQAWIKKFGGNQKFSLQCAVYNHFLNEEQNKQAIINALKGNKPFNVNFFPLMTENAIYNEFLNSADIIIGMSGGEGFGLPEFQSIALGKHAVMLKAHAYESWATDDMVTWVNPSSVKVPAYDGVFFGKGQAFNQGNIFDFNEDEFLAACDAVIAKVQQNRVNEAGLALQKQYTKEAFVDAILYKTFKVPSG